MNLVTERCTIREFTINEIDSFMEYRNNMDWMHYQGFKGLTKSVYEKELLESHSLIEGMQFAILNTSTKKLLGDIYLRQENNVYWLGYTIHPLYARQGYAAEAVEAIINWAANQGAAMLKAGVLPDNIASIKLLEKHCFAYSTKEDDELIYVMDLQN